MVKPTTNEPTATSTDLISLSTGQSTSTSVIHVPRSGAPKTEFGPSMYDYVASKLGMTVAICPRAIELEPYLGAHEIDVGIVVGWNGHMVDVWFSMPDDGSLCPDSDPDTGGCYHSIYGKDLTRVHMWTKEHEAKFFDRMQQKGLELRELSEFLPMHTAVLASSCELPASNSSDSSD